MFYHIRKRILQMIHPVWPIKRRMRTAKDKLGHMKNKFGEVTENVLLRLVFHDCIPYMDGTGIPNFKIKQDLYNTNTIINRWM